MTDQKPFEQRLRAEAEARLKIDPTALSELSHDDKRKLLEELLIHQTEMEIQNEELLRVQAELNTMRDQHAALFNEAPVGYLRINDAGLILQSNRAFTEMVGVEQDKLVEKPVADLFYGQDRDLFRSRFRTFFKQPSGKVLEMRMQSAKGGYFHARLEGRTEELSSYNTPKARNEELLLIVADVTEVVEETTACKKAHDDLAQRERQLTALLDASRAVLQHTDFETAARKIFDRCKEITGAMAGYVALLSEAGDENEVLFLESGGLPCSVDESLPMPIRGLRETAYRTGRPAYENSFATSEWMKFMPEGHVELRNVMFAPLTNRGSVVGLIGLANKEGDFTDEDASFASALGDIASIALMNSRNLDRLRENEQQLEFSLDHTNSILESISDAFFSLDEDLRVTYFNRAAEEVLGRRAEEVLGQPLFEAFPEAKGSIFEEQYRRCLNEERAVSFEVHFDIPPYENWYDVRVYPQQKGISVYFRVITERKEAEREKQKLEDQLRQAQKMEAVGQLAAGIAHDFNNMLSPILGYADMIQRDATESERTRKYAGQVVKAATRSRDLVQQLLAFGRKQMLNMEVFDLGSAVAESVKILEHTIRESIEIKLNLSEETPKIRGDRSQISQVVMNLAVNAQDAMPKGGVLEIRTGTADLDEEFVKTCPELVPGRYGTLEVLDTGVGMKAELMEHVFEPFFTTKNMAEGTGLGLASVYGIVKQHGGHLTVTSTEGEGSRFTIYLPAVDGVPAESIRPAVEGVASNGKRGTILVVEDDPMVRDLTCDVLRRFKFRVLCATSPQEGLLLAERHAAELDLLLTDVVMPQMTGKELHEKACEHNPGLKVLYMSGYSENVIAKHGVIDPGVNMITKPFTITQLVESVQQSMSEQRQSALGD